MRPTDPVWRAFEGPAHWHVVDQDFDAEKQTGRCVAACDSQTNAKRIAAALNSAPRLARALRGMIGAHSALMPGLKHIAVQNYQLQNEAPIEAKLALTAYEKGRRP